MFAERMQSLSASPHFSKFVEMCRKPYVVEVGSGDPSEKSVLAQTGKLP